MERPPRAEPRILPIRARERYIEVLTEAFASLRGLNRRIVYDCGNGVAGTVLPEIFRRLEIDATGLCVEPDGTFPHHHPDPSVEANLADVKRALQSGEYDLAFAFDGDADRLAVLTPRHNIKGDQLALLYTLTMERPTVIGEVKCSQVMYDELERRGATAIMYKTGHSNLKVKIRESGADLACEVSGHIFFADRYYGYDDAIYAALRFLELLRAGIDPDAEIDALPPVYATEEIKLPATEEGKFRLVEKVRSLLEEPPAGFPAIREILTVDGLRIHFDRGWALVRASNTTPVLVTRYEAEDAATARHYREALEALVERARSD
jgi:phosphomannomutase/phosphoglucomutase